MLYKSYIKSYIKSYSKSDSESSGLISLNTPLIKSQKKKNYNSFKKIPFLNRYFDSTNTEQEELSVIPLDGARYRCNNNTSIASLIRSEGLCANGGSLLFLSSLICLLIESMASINNKLGDLFISTKKLMPRNLKNNSQILIPKRSIFTNQIFCNNGLLVPFIAYGKINTAKDEFDNIKIVEPICS